MAARISTFSRLLYQVVKPHIPMIKFRKGSPNLISTTTQKSQPESATVSASSPAAGSSPSSRAKVISRPLIEDYQLPQRYKRLQLDESEINAINSGGAYT